MAKTSEEDDTSMATNEDHEIELAVAELEGIPLANEGQTDVKPISAIEPEGETPFDDLSIPEVAEHLKRSAKMVIDTCMDIRRGENVLIVCDPTTGDIGQALHEAANERSDRVLLIVMPVSYTHLTLPTISWG